MEMDGNTRRKAVFDFVLNGKVGSNLDNFYKPRDGDIIVVGPPKSGTTWMQQILHQMRTKGDENFSGIYDVTWWICNPSCQYEFNYNQDQKYNPRIFKTHEAFGVIGSTEKQKHIVIVRDPYDAAYSWSKFVNGFYGDDGEISEEDLVEMMMTFHEKDAIGNFRCISTWWLHRDDPNVLYLFYEDLKLDLEKVIKKISEFVEIALTEEELRRVLHFCSFEYMAEHKEKFQGEAVIATFAQETQIEKWKPKAGMVRADGGKVGEGLKNIGPKLKAMVDRLWKETIEEQTGYKSYREMYTENNLFGIKFEGA